MQKNIHPPSLRGAKRRSSLGVKLPTKRRSSLGVNLPKKRRSSLGLKLTQKLQTLFKLLLLSITLTTTLLAQDMYRPPYESTLNIEPRAKQWYHYAWSLKEYKYTANNLGYIYEDLKEYDKAKQWYEKAVERVNQVCLT